MTQTIETFDFDVNLFTSILWQYENSNNLKSLVTNKNVWMSVYYTSFWNAWFYDIFNLQTANLFGLTVWSIILDLPLYVPLTPVVPGNYFGFNSTILLNGYKNFQNGNFPPGNIAPLLTQEEQRICLKLKYYQCVTRGSLGDVNPFLDFVFSDLGGCWLIDNLNMTIKYFFNFFPSTGLIRVINSNLLLPKPAGVAITYFNPSGQIIIP